MLCHRPLWHWCLGWGLPACGTGQGRGQVQRMRQWTLLHMRTHAGVTSDRLLRHTYEACACVMHLPSPLAWSADLRLMPPWRVSPLMSPSPSNVPGMPTYVSCQVMEGLGAPPHVEDEAALLDDAKAQARPPGLAIGCADMRRAWETTGSGMGVMEEGAASVWKGLKGHVVGCRRRRR